MPATVEYQNRCLAERLAQDAICHTEHPADAASALLTAATLILDRTMSPDQVAAVVGQAFDESAAEWRHRHAN